MKTQRPDGTITLFQHFRGLVKEIAIFQADIGLPMWTPSGPKAVLRNNKLLVFLKLDAENVYNKNGKYYLNNLAIHDGHGDQDIPLNGEPDFGYTYWEDFEWNKKNVKGTPDDPTVIFDGIACND